MTSAHSFLYFLAAGLVVLACWEILERSRTVDDFVRSLVVAMAIGWMSWPLVLWASLSGRNEPSDRSVQASSGQADGAAPDRASESSCVSRAWGWTAAALWALLAVLFYASPTEHPFWVALPYPAALCSICWVGVRYFGR